MANLRDLGGMAAADGRRTRGGTLFRSEAPAHLDGPERERLAGAGLAHVFDLRSAPERAAEPAPWLDALPLRRWAPHAGADIGDPAQLARHALESAEETRAFMRRIYRAIPRDHAAAFAVLFTALADGAAPALLHCAAGKDRTGVAVALLLDASGVARDAILTDYLRTNAARDAIAARFLRDPRTAVIAAAPPHVWAPMLDADAAYLCAMFERVDAEHGGGAGYAARALGLRERGVERLRDRLLEA